MHATSSFVLDSNVEDPASVFECDGVHSNQMRIEKTFTGDLAGRGSVNMLSVRGAAGAGYVALERINGTLHGRSGGFSLLHCGRWSGQLASSPQSRRACPACLSTRAAIRTGSGGKRKPSLTDTLARVQAYTAAGADCVFVPGVAEDASIAAIVDAVDVPLNVLCMPGRYTLGRQAELGVMRVSLGSLLFRVGLGAAVAAAVAVRDGQSVELTGVPSYAWVEALLPVPAADRV